MKKGFVGIIVAVIIAALAVGGGVYYYRNHTNSNVIYERPIPTDNGQASTTATVKTTTKDLTVGELENIKFIDGSVAPVREIQLKPGGTEYFYKGKGGDVVSEGTLSISNIKIGDLNKDGNKDAAAIMVRNSNGTGVFYNLIAFINKNGVPQQTNELNLGDRIDFRSIEIQVNGTIAVTFVTDDDYPGKLCHLGNCNNLPGKTHLYHLVGDTLTEGPAI